MTMTQAQKEYYTNIMGAKRFAEEFPFDALTQQDCLRKTAYEMHPPDLEGILEDLRNIKVWIEVKTVSRTKPIIIDTYCNFETSQIMFAGQDIANYFFDHTQKYINSYKSSALEATGLKAGDYFMLTGVVKFIRWCTLKGYIAFPMLKEEYVLWDSPLEASHISNAGRFGFSGSGASQPNARTDFHWLTR